MPQVALLVSICFYVVSYYIAYSGLSILGQSWWLVIVLGQISGSIALIFGGLKGLVRDRGDWLAISFVLSLCVLLGSMVGLSLAYKNWEIANNPPAARQMR